MSMRRRLLVFVIALCAAGSGWAGGGERLSLDGGWLFHLGDVAATPVKGHGMSYFNGKANNGSGAAGADYDDSGWRRLDLPHDWVVEGPFDPNENASQGYRPRGIAWYRRYVQLAPEDRGRHIELQFDAIATHSTVWVNGVVVNRNWSGYNGRSIDITPFLHYGEESNTIAVRVDANAQEGWWYEGAGIYRHTWLVKRDALHIATDGLHANPVQEGGRWTLPVAVDVVSSAKAARGGVLEVSLLDPEGREVARASAPVRVEPMKTYFQDIPSIAYRGRDSDDALSFRYYDKDRVVLGKRMMPATISPITRGCLKWTNSLPIHRPSSRIETSARST